MTDFSTLVSKDLVQKTIDALKENGINAEFVQTADEAKEKVLSLIPKKAEVMTMTSVTLDSIGILEVLNNSGEYDSVRNKLNSMDRMTQGREMQKLGAAPDYAVGSVHAVSQDGKVFIASNTGSQLPAYVSGAGTVVWVVGVQKIVADQDEAFKRIYEYVLPKETLRARKAYNQPDTFHSNVSKLLIINKEINPTRLHIIFVNETLGF